MYFCDKKQNMKKIITFAVLAITSLIYPFADNLPTPKKQEIPGEPSKPINPPSTRPKVPANIFLELEYVTSENTIMFSHLPDMMYMSVDIEDLNNGLHYYDFVTPNNPTIEIELSGGTYYIICITDTDITYAGEFFIF